MNGILFILISGFGIFLVSFEILLPLPPAKITKSTLFIFFLIKYCSFKISVNEVNIIKSY